MTIDEILALVRSASRTDGGAGRREMRPPFNYLVAPSFKDGDESLVAAILSKKIAERAVLGNCDLGAVAGLRASIVCGSLVEFLKGSISESRRFEGPALYLLGPRRDDESMYRWIASTGKHGDAVIFNREIVTVLRYGEWPG